MGCGCGGQKLPESAKQAQPPAAEQKASPMFPPSYFWNGPQPKKT